VLQDVDRKEQQGDRGRVGIGKGFLHRTNVMTKLEVQTTVELIRFVSNNPLVSTALTE
jgi:hypothetical protein